MIAEPSVSSTFRKATGSSTATLRSVSATRSGPSAKTWAASTAESHTDSGSKPWGSTERSTLPLWESSQRPSVNGAAAVASAGIPTVAERTAASTAPERSTGATEAKETSVHSGLSERQRTGS